MPRGKVATVGCVGCMALPFLLIGISVLSDGIRRHNPATTIFGAIWLAMVLMIFGIGGFAVKSLPPSVTSAQQLTRTPWTLRSDWASGRIADASSNGSFLLWPFAIVWNAIAWALLWPMRDQVLHASTPAALFALVFPVAGLVLLIAATRYSMRRARFGSPVCQLDSVPGEPGKPLRGAIEVRGDRLPDSGFRLMLSGARDAESTTVPWNDERLVPSGSAMRGASGWRIPFEFTIPDDARPTDTVYSRRGGFGWRMNVQAGDASVAAFEIPVYAPIGSTAEAEGERRFPAHPVAADSGITFGSSIDGALEITVTPRRTASVAMPWFVIMVVMIAFASVAFYSHRFFGVAIFGAIGVLVGLALADSLFAKSTVRVYRNRIDFIRSMPGARRWQTIDATKLTAVAARAGDRSGRTVLFSVHAVVAGQSDIVIARSIWGRDNADAIAGRIWQALDHSP